MSGDRSRQLFYAEGFGYTTSQLRQIYKEGTAAATATVDTTTVAGRNFLRLPANQYLDITLPRHDVYPFTETFNDGNWAWVIQAKIYIDAASYTNVSANSFLFEMRATDGFSAFGLSPNTSTAQDNWWIRTSDSTSNDYAINTNNGPQPAIPMRTVRDVKFIIRVAAGNDYQAWAYIDDNQVAYTNYINDEADNLNDRFKAVRLWGLANQTGDTLWGDVIVYRAWVSDEGATLNRGATLTGGAALSKNVRVYDVTPTTTVGGINDFVTVGAADPITALSTLDAESGVVSSDFGQVFRLKPSLPKEYTGDGSTAITITDSSNVYGFNYMHWGRDANLSNARYMVSVSEDSLGDSSLTSYRFRYYRLLLSTYTSNNTGSTLNGINFYDEIGYINWPLGSTMRLNSAGGTTASASSGAIINTTTHTALLGTVTGSVNIYNTINALTGRNIRDDSVVAEYIIDCGEGNVMGDWTMFGITQTQGDSSRLISAALFGSNDNSSWILLADNYDTMSAGGTLTTDFLINPRHPRALRYNSRGMTKELAVSAVSFTNPSGLLSQQHMPYPGDPFASAHLNGAGTSKTPIPFRQFKDYQFGIETLAPQEETLEYYNYINALTPPTQPGDTVFEYTNFATLPGLTLLQSGAGGGQVINNEVYLTTYTGGVGNLYRVVPDNFNYDWGMTWTMEINGSADGAVLQWTTANNLIGSSGGGVGTVNLSTTAHALQFRTWVHNTLTWLKNNVSQGNFVSEGWRGRLYYWAEYDHSESTLKLSWNTSRLRLPPRVTLTNFSFPDSTQYYLGFGAATGGSTGEHRLIDWRFYRAANVVVPPIDQGIVTSNLSMDLDAGDITSYSGSGTTWYDISGGGNNGTLINGPTYSSTVGGNIVFDGVNDYVGNIPDFSLGTAFTFSAWIKTTQSTLAMLIARGNNANDRGVYMSINNNNDGFLYAGGNNGGGWNWQKISNTSINDGNWHHVACVYNQSTNSVTGYVDGVAGLTATVTFDGNSYTPKNTTVGRNQIGNSQFYTGSMARAMIHNRALTASDISINHNAFTTQIGDNTTGLLMSLDASDPASYPGTGSTWYDISGNNNHATLVNSPTYVQEPELNYFNLNGTNQYITAPSATLPSGTSNFTLSIWVYFDENLTGRFYSQDGRGAVLFSGNNDFTMEFLALNNTAFTPPDALNLGRYAASSSGSLTYAATGNVPIRKWHNIVLVRDGTASQKLYLNGALVQTGNISDGFASGTLHIGGAPNNSNFSAYLNGRVGAVRMWNRALSAVDVYEDYLAVDEERRNLVMKLDATDTSSYPGTGSTWFDLSGNGYNGSLANGATYNATNGRGISFDGSDDIVNIGSMSQSFSSFTVTVLFYPTQVASFRNVMDCNLQYSGSTGNLGPRLEMNSSGTLGWVWSNSFNNDTFSSQGVVASGLQANQWHWAAITYDGATGVSTTYYNGAATALGRGGSGQFIGSFNDVRIGRGFGLTSRYFQGKIAVSRIYNRALTAAEMLSIYNIDSGRLSL